MPIGHVVRAKMFTVKGKDSSMGPLTGLGYVTFSNMKEADLAVVRLDKTQLKGVSVDVNKVLLLNMKRYNYDGEIRSKVAGISTQSSISQNKEVSNCIYYNYYYYNGNEWRKYDREERRREDERIEWKERGDCINYSIGCE